MRVRKSSVIPDSHQLEPLHGARSLARTLLSQRSAVLGRPGSRASSRNVEATKVGVTLVGLVAGVAGVLAPRGEDVDLDAVGVGDPAGLSVVEVEPALLAGRRGGVGEGEEGGLAILLTVPDVAGDIAVGSRGRAVVVPGVSESVADDGGGSNLGWCLAGRDFISGSGRSEGQRSEKGDDGSLGEHIEFVYWLSWNMDMRNGGCCCGC